MKSKTNWKKIDAKRDKDIDYSDIPEQGGDFFKKAVLKMPQKKTIITIRIENDVLEWFKSQGRGYQTRIGALLRAYKEAHSRTSHHRA
ncbi:MAG: BrnA antitoxin family protein [Gammaproteobacteria bacterium]|nr:BrnA antitoxin family protein [Gammaproteobacteria bacterium]